jgi:hypothetical protein
VAAHRVAEPLIRLVVEGNNQQAGGVPIQAMHDSPAILCAHAPDPRPAMEDPPGEGSPTVTCTRMGHDPGRLVDDGEVFVLVAHRKGNVLRSQSRFGGR